MQRSVRTHAFGVLALLLVLSGSLQAQFTDPKPAAVGVPYTFDAVSALVTELNSISSLAGPDFSFSYSFAVSGNAPPGLSLGSNGVISGTPTTAGQFDFTINLHFTFSIALPPGTPSV